MGRPELPFLPKDAFGCIQLLAPRGAGAVRLAGVGAGRRGRARRRSSALRVRRVVAFHQTESRLLTALLTHMYVTRMLPATQLKS